MNNQAQKQQQTLAAEIQADVRTGITVMALSHCGVVPPTNMTPKELRRLHQADWPTLAQGVDQAYLGDRRN